MKRSPLDALIDAERRAPPRPTGEEAKAGWEQIRRDVAVGVVAPFDLSPASVAPVAKTGLLASTMAKVVVAAAVTGGSGAAVIGSMQADPPRAPVAEAKVERVAPIPAAAPMPEPAPEVLPAAAVPVSEPERAVEAPPRTRASRPRRAPVAPPPHSGIARELDLIKRAGKAVNVGRFAQALELASTHAREFPEGTLTEDRQALHVLALCGAGRTTEGARAKRRFFEHWPDSVHAKRLVEACASHE